MTAEDKRGSAPIDRGWAWVVMAAVMLSTFLEMGLYRSFGIFFVEFIETFGSSATMTSVISGVYLAGYSIFALVMMTYGLGKVSCRQSVMTGGVFLAVGYLLSSMATSIEAVILAQGVFTAIGSALIHGPSIVILSKYFDKRRGLSNSLAISCGSLGGLVLPILFHELVEMYNLNGALMITSGIILNCTLAGTLMRPIDQYKLESNDSFLTKEINSQDVEEAMNVSNGEDIQMLQNSRQNTRSISSTETIKKTTDINESSGSCISLTHIPNYTVDHEVQLTVDDIDNSKCALRCGILSQIFDCSLFKNSLFLIVLSAVCLGQIECALAHIFIPPYAKDQGIADSDIALIAGTIGIAEFVGRCLVSLLADVRCIERHVLISGSLIITGIVTHFVHLYDSLWTFVMFSVLYGIFSGVLVALYSPLCVDLLGADRMRKAYGISCSFTGIATGASAPLFGFLRDMTGSYVLSFHLMGGCAMIGGSVLLLLPWAKRYEDRKLKKNQIAKQIPCI
ncbi:monocarboxylate transporter 12-B-like [Pecten maximus]|uniref:monocarboxylate transporter 12-B-like n=1 Tax=Pecten maximus TaxID=6579 RepID=UPI0014589102|nr:monocarboxylate transporter 12-B-like [Pecten maximus]